MLMETRHRRYFPLSATLLGSRAKKLSRGPPRSRSAIFKAKRAPRLMIPARAFIFPSPLSLSLSPLKGQYNRSINRRFPIILPLHSPRIYDYFCAKQCFLLSFFRILCNQRKNRVCLSSISKHTWTVRARNNNVVMVLLDVECRTTDVVTSALLKEWII